MNQITDPKIVSINLLLTLVVYRIGLIYQNLLFTAISDQCFNQLK